MTAKLYIYMESGGVRRPKLSWGVIGGKLCFAPCPRAAWPVCYSCLRHLSPPHTEALVSRGRAAGSGCIHAECGRPGEVFQQSGLMGPNQLGLECKD